MFTGVRPGSGRGGGMKKKQIRSKTDAKAVQERAVDPDADQREQQRDVAEIQEVGRPVVIQVNRNKHRHEGGISKLEPQRHAAERLRHGRCQRHGVMLLQPGSIRPERMRTTRSQRRASSGSWVTSTKVVPRASWPANIRSMISAPRAS